MLAGLITGGGPDAIARRFSSGVVQACNLNCYYIGYIAIVNIVGGVAGAISCRAEIIRRAIKWL